MNRNLGIVIAFISGAITGGLIVYQHVKTKYEQDLIETREIYQRYSDGLRDHYKAKEEKANREAHDIRVEMEKTEFEQDKLQDFGYHNIENYNKYYNLRNKPDPEDILRELAEAEHPEEEIGAQWETEDEKMERMANENKGKLPEVITIDEYNDPDYSYFDKELISYEKVSGDFSSDEGEIIVDPYILLGENNIDPAENNVFDRAETGDYVYVRNYGIGVDYMVHITELPEEGLQ